MYISNKVTIYFDGFGTEHIPEGIQAITGNKVTKTNTFMTQANNSVMCGDFCISFNNFMIASKTLIGFTSFVSRYDF